MWPTGILVPLTVFYMTLVMALDSPSPTDTEPRGCLVLNNITNIAVKDSKYLFDALTECRTKPTNNFTLEAYVLFEIFNTIKAEDYASIKKLINELSPVIEKCVSEATSKKFTAETAGSKFGFDDTKALSFDNDNCENSDKLSRCMIEHLYGDDSTLTSERKSQKDMLEKAFNVTSTICEQFIIRDDRSNSSHLYSSIAVTLGSSMMMMFKLLLVSHF